MVKQISRRTFTKWSLTAVATAGIAAFLRKVVPPFGTSNIEKYIDGCVHAAFRLTDYRSLLNLEFYFVNCKYDGKKVWAKYGAYENYMIVRLPQQHVAETCFTEGNPEQLYRAATYISDYSYLVFRILFPDDGAVAGLFTGADGRYTSIDLDKESLLDWNCKRKFRLVVRQDLTESLFELKQSLYYSSADAARVSVLQDTLAGTSKEDMQQIRQLQTAIDSIERPWLENHYPFQQEHKKDTLKIAIDTSAYDIDKLPHVYGDPVTAIELPWRLVISPKLPDSSRFEFKWDIPPTYAGSPYMYKLWTARLSITERTDLEYIKRIRSEKKHDSEDARSASTGELTESMNQLELMILGSPDSNAASGQYNDILPGSLHRKDLVDLYIKLKIVAKTDQLLFSAVGASVKIHLKNEKIEDALKKGIGVIEWNQVISMGRDERVEISTLFLEAEFGHKMACIELVDRHVKRGFYPLIKRTFIVPLDITKDYTNHQTQTTELKDKQGRQEIISRFNSPFQKITFLSAKPKELVNGPFNYSGLHETGTSFEFEALDWHGNKVRFTKKINAIPFGFAVSKIQGTRVPANLIDSVFNGSKLYLSDTGNTISDDAKIVFKDRQAVATDSSGKNLAGIKALDEQVTKLKDSTARFHQTLNSVFLTGEPLPVILSEDDFASDLEEYFASFFQYIRNQVTTWYTKGERDLKAITTRLAAIEYTTVLAFLADQYFFVDKSNFERIQTVYRQALVSAHVISIPEKYLDEFIRPALSNTSLTTRFKTYLDMIGSEEILDPSWNNNTLFVRYTFEKWLMLDEFNVFKSGGNTTSAELIKRWVTVSPESQKVIAQLRQLFKKTDAEVGSLLRNIRERINIFYSLEKQARDIPGVILLYKQKIGYAIREKYDAARLQMVNELNEELTGAKKSLSELESEYIIFRGGLRQAAGNSFDFFHDYAVIPQVEQAKVYISALNKLVNEDLPVTINYAREYIENQVRDIEFEVKQNAAMVFGEVQQYSRDQVRGLIQKIGSKMPGFNVEIPVHFLTYARNPQELADESIGKIKEQLGIAGNDFATELKKYSRDLVFMSEDLKNSVKVMDDLRQADPKKYFRDLGAKLFGSIGLEDILDIGFDLPRITELPDKIIYQVSTDKFKNFRASFVSFTPNVGGKTSLTLFSSKSLKDMQAYYAYTELSNFSIGVVLGGTDVLTITFSQFKISSSPGQPKKTDISITDVKLGGPLEFIADLAKKFMAPGNGMRVRPGARNLLVDYTIAFPDVKAPAFNFRNLQLVIGVNIPYDPSVLRAISFTFGVNKPDDKFLVSAGIYGGRGHFMLRATPKGIEYMDVSIELGAYAAIDLGIGKGEVFLFFGFWFVTGTDGDGQSIVKAVAYVICAGSATVLGFITIGVSVFIALTYIKRGEESLFYGEAVVTYSVKIAFFKKEFSIRYYKEIAGSAKGNGTRGVQIGMVLLNSGLPGGISLNTDENGAVRFTDVFKNETALEDYLACFA